MKHPKISIALFVLIGIIFMAAAFTMKKSPKKMQTDWTQYYWFDGNNNYLYRQNMLDDEIDLTGFDLSDNSPFTLQEKGFAPGSVQGDPPVPTTPWAPERRLYSHP